LECFQWKTKVLELYVLDFGAMFALFLLAVCILLVSLGSYAVDCCLIQKFLSDVPFFKPFIRVMSGL
jgi:hypothetical protein